MPTSPLLLPHKDTVLFSICANSFLIYHNPCQPRKTSKGVFVWNNIRLAKLGLNIRANKLLL